MTSSKFLFVTALVLGMRFSVFSMEATPPMSPEQKGILHNTSSSDLETLETEASLHVTAHYPSMIGIQVTKDTMNILNKLGEQATEPEEYTARFKLLGCAKKVKIAFSAEGNSASTSGEFRITRSGTSTYIPVLISYVGSGGKDEKIENVMNNKEITIDRKSADTEYGVTAKVQGKLPLQKSENDVGDYEGTIKLQVAPAN